MHEYIPELKELYRQGKITRREFARHAALLGLSMTAISSFLASCAPAPTATPVPPAPTAKPAAGPTTAAPTVAPTAVPAATVKRGGTLRVYADLRRLVDPAVIEWTQFNLFRNVAEYLAVTGTDNVTRPWLLEKWEPSDDLKTWTLFVRKGIKFNTGEDLTADVVKWNLDRLLTPSTGSMTAKMMSYVESNGVEKIDDFTLKLHLKTAQFLVPENLYHYQNVMLLPSFKGDWIAQPQGTGPYTLVDYVAQERARIQKREGYWKNGLDGKPLPYIDSIQFLTSPGDAAASLASLMSDQIDITSMSAALIDTAKQNPNIVVATTPSTGTLVFGMQVDQEPFTNEKVRQAIKMVQPKQEITYAIYREYASIADDYHCAPAHPEYCEIRKVPTAPDIEGAKKLLAEAGHADGLKVTLSISQSEAYMTQAQLMKESAAKAGIDITIAILPSAIYTDQWNKVPFVITSWMHRARAVMTMDLAYRKDAQWNHTHWSDPVFEDLLNQMEASADIEKTKKLMCQAEQIMLDKSGTGIPYWWPSFAGHNKRVKGFKPSPDSHQHYADVWLDV